MFGSGRYRFYVERPKSEEPPVEIFKPVHPFMLQWDVLTHPGGGKKKPPTVKGMCDWRNPMGFACHVDDSKPPAEFVGCCASIQGPGLVRIFVLHPTGLEGGAQAFVSGASVLPMRFLPALLSTLCPERWCVAWGVDAGSSEVRGVRILHHELAVNALRTGLREALYPASWWTWDGWGTDSRGRNHRGRHEDRDGELLDLPDLSQLLRELIEVLPDPESSGVQRPKKMKWPPATTFSQDWEEEDECFLRTLQPLAEREESNVSAAFRDTNFRELVEHLAKNGECAISSLPSKIRGTKKQPDLFVIRPTKKDFFVRLAGTASTEVATSNAKTKAQKGAGGQERPLVDALVRVLTGRGAVGLGELGSQESLKKLLKKQQPDLRKIRQFVKAFPGVFHLSTDASGQVAVTLLSGDGVRSLPLVKSTQGKSGKGGKRSTSGAKHKGSNPSVLTEHISSLCGSSAATAADFDGRVKALLLDVQDRGGQREPLAPPLAISEGYHIGIYTHLEVRVREGDIGAMAEPMATEGASPQKKRGPPEEENLSLEAIREVVRGEICGSNAALKAELSHRMDRVEHGVTNQLEKILEKLAAIAGQQQRVVETIQGEQYAMNTRLQMLEQKVGGDDSPAEETLNQVRQMVKDLRIDIDTVQAFVPGVRRGYAIMPQGPREGEDQQQMRERLSAALRRVRQANIQTGAHDALDAAFAVAREAEAGATRRNVQAPLPDVGGNVGASGDRMADGDGWISLKAIGRGLSQTSKEVEDEWGQLRTALR
eukprot:s3879_g11.t1